MVNMNGQTAGLRMGWWTNVPCEWFIFDSRICDHSDIVITLLICVDQGALRAACVKTEKHVIMRTSYTDIRTLSLCERFICVYTSRTLHLCVRFKNASFVCMLQVHLVCVYASRTLPFIAAVSNNFNRSLDHYFCPFRSLFEFISIDRKTLG